MLLEYFAPWQPQGGCWGIFMSFYITQCKALHNLFYFILIINFCVQNYFLSFPVDIIYVLQVGCFKFTVAMKRNVMEIELDHKSFSVLL